jgi:hypothetical protein
MAPDCRMVDSFLQRSLEMWNAFGTTPEFHLLAQVVSSFPADATLTAGNANFQRNTVADIEAIDLWPNRNDDTRGFMA